MKNWPLQSEAQNFYGNPRSKMGSVVSSAWYRANIIMVKPPFAMRMLEPIEKFPIHKKCAEATLAWLEAVWDNASRDQREIDDWGMNIFSGSFCFRQMRGSQHLSMHAYGCAIDFDAPRNAMFNGAPNFTKLRAEVIEPFYRFGGVWGGDWNGNGSSRDERRADGMHFQFAKMG
jgi:D-alanyl-D-alanine carboxypeptidase